MGGPFELAHAKLGCLPIVNRFLERMGAAGLIERHLPRDDERLRLAPADVIGVVVRNIICAHAPLYGLKEWAAPYESAQLGLGHGDQAALNDDRVGRMLDRLFDCDRASLMTEVVLLAVREFRIDFSRFHNDSTTVSFHGSYRSANGQARSGKRTPVITHGFNKDHRPDLLQLVYVLTVASDGAIPILHRVMDGNVEDSTTHIETWDQLVALVGGPDFVYVADSKLCTTDAMGHIAKLKGRFVTVIPHGRREDTWFRDFVQSHVPDWTEAHRERACRIGEPDRIWRTFVAPVPSADGYRVIWVHSTDKVSRDATYRQSRIEAGLVAIDAIAGRLASPKSRLISRQAVEEAATQALASAKATRWVGFSVAKREEERFSQERRGRPGANTRYRRRVKTVFTIEAQINAKQVAYDAASDGCFPLVTNTTAESAAEVLAIYRYQPNLERRHHMFKGPQEVAPVFVENPHRIEAILFCHFLAMLVEALVEREIRSVMAERGLKGIPLYPELRNCPSPSAPRIFEIFADAQRHHLIAGGEVLQDFDPELTPLQKQVLELLHVPESVYISVGTS